MSDSWQPHGLQPTRLLCPWDLPGKSPGVGCHCLLRTPPALEGKILTTGLPGRSLFLSVLCDLQLPSSFFLHKNFYILFIPVFFPLPKFVVFSAFAISKRRKPICMSMFVPSTFSTKKKEKEKESWMYMKILNYLSNYNSMSVL